MGIAIGQNQLSAYTQQNVGQTQSSNPASSAKVDDKNASPTGGNVNISEQSKMHVKLDNMLDEVDSIYMSKLSGSDKKALEKAYEALDKLYQSGEPNGAGAKQADKLFDKVDEILNKAEKAMTPEQKKKVDELNGKIDSLLEKYDFEDEEYAEELMAKLEPLDKELDGLIASTLSAAEKKQLAGLNKELDKLFDKSKLSDEDKKAMEASFAKIDKILDKSYNALSDDQKKRVGELEDKIDTVIDALDAHESKTTGYSAA